MDLDFPENTEFATVLERDKNKCQGYNIEIRVSKTQLQHGIGQPGFNPDFCSQPISYVSSTFPSSSFFINRLEKSPTSSGWC